MPPASMLPFGKTNDAPITLTRQLKPVSLVRKTCLSEQIFLRWAKSDHGAKTLVIGKQHMTPSKATPSNINLRTAARLDRIYITTRQS